MWISCRGRARGPGASAAAAITAGGYRRWRRRPAVWTATGTTGTRSGSAPGRGRARGPGRPTPTAWTPSCCAHGDRRNVVDGYRYWRHEAIVADLDTRRHGFHVAIENWQHDLNIGSVVRTANAFLAAEVHVVGRRRWNRRGAMVTDRYQHVRHHPDVEDARRLGGGAGLPVVGDRQPARRRAARDLRPAAACVLLFGQEGPGLSEAAREACATRCCRSPSSARPGRSTPGPPRRSRCTPGSAPTATSPPPGPVASGDPPVSERRTGRARGADQRRLG